MRDIPEKFTSRIEVSGDHWVWTGPRTHKTPIHNEGCRKFLAHRVIYMECVGEINPRQTLHRRCKTDFCCNPDHFHLVTLGEYKRPIPKFHQMTEYLTPNNYITCQYGRVSIETWLRFEAMRIAESGYLEAEVRSCKNNHLIALFVKDNAEP